MQAAGGVRAAVEAVELEFKTAALEQAERTLGPAHAAALASLRQDEPWQTR